MLRREIQKPPELKTLRDMLLMREAGKVVAKALRLCREMAKPGVKTADINQAVENLYLAHGAISLFKGYDPGANGTPFPSVTCISLNEQVVHGIPGNRLLRDGDLLKVDTACKLNGWCADAAVSIPIGTVRPERLRLVRVAESVLQTAIEEIGRRRWWSEVAQKMQRKAVEAGFSVVEQYVGHGIGREMHEAPQVPNFVNKELRKSGDFRLEPGIVLAVEPMVNMGQCEVELLNDQWTVITRDGMPSVHVEHTLALTPQGVVVLTADEGDPRGEIRWPETAGVVKG
ncbi:type I methionyl aminopeptidase [Zavarzinella formosa]|uniref:type I methionyl aminopeptidase n=1 Tax=Zavarzinella formosa TaxID=360055 RepID=UPI0002E95C04|nr:type I methionyl aminopeptidase [Zavarzinella formosa]